MGAAPRPASSDSTPPGQECSKGRSALMGARGVLCFWSELPTGPPDPITLSSVTDPVRRIGVLLALVLAFGALSACSSVTGDNCTRVVVATSSEKVNLMVGLGEAFKGSPEADGLKECATITPINVSSGVGAEILSAAPKRWPLANQDDWPTIRSPASTVWTDRFAATGSTNLVNGAESFARTPWCSVFRRPWPARWAIRRRPSV